MKDLTPTTTSKVVPLSSIDPNAIKNCRSHVDPVKVERLVKSIRKRGLLDPLTVTNGGDTYGLINGFNRYEALKELGFKEVRVEIRKYDEKDPLAPFIENLANNVARDDVHPADLSRRIGEIVSGEVLRKSEEDPLEDAPKIDKKDLAHEIGLSISHFGNLLRADQKLIPEVKAAWRKYDISLHSVLEWSTMEPEAQAEQLAEWITERERLLQSGKKRKPNGSGKGKKGKKESEDERHERMSVQELRIALGNLQDKLDRGKVNKGADKAFVEGKIRGLELALGDISIQAFNRSY